MRLAAAGVVLVLALAAPAGAAQQPIPPEQRPVLCANSLLEYLTDSPREPYRPTFHLGLATWFMGCAYSLPPFVGPILSSMQGDIQTVERYREELGAEAPELHRGVVCGSWTALYRGIYDWTLWEYGSAAIPNLPRPDAHADACERWVEGD